MLLSFCIENTSILSSGELSELVSKSDMGKIPIQVQDRPMNFKVSEYEKFIEMHYNQSLSYPFQILI